MISRRRRLERENDRRRRRTTRRLFLVHVLVRDLCFEARAHIESGTSLTRSVINSDAQKKEA